MLLKARSIRRGALIAMAESGVDEETLLLFSCYTSTTMLHRYLGWGAHMATNRTKGAAAARAALCPFFNRGPRWVPKDAKARRRAQRLDELLTGLKNKASYYDPWPQVHSKK